MNNYLTPAMHRVLTRMRDEELELDHVPGEVFWYLDSDRVHPGTAKRLLELCLISGSFKEERGAVNRFTLNEDGRGVLESDVYVPRIVKAFRERECAGQDSNLRPRH